MYRDEIFTGLSKISFPLTAVNLRNVKCAKIVQGKNLMTNIRTIVQHSILLSFCSTLTCSCGFLRSRWVEWQRQGLTGKVATKREEWKNSCNCTATNWDKDSWLVVLYLVSWPFFRRFVLGLYLVHGVTSPKRHWNSYAPTERNKNCLAPDPDRILATSSQAILVKPTTIWIGQPSS